jgi:hypothetical protein
LAGDVEETPAEPTAWTPLVDTAPAVQPHLFFRSITNAPGDLLQLASGFAAWLAVLG